MPTHPVKCSAFKKPSRSRGKVSDYPPSLRIRHRLILGYKNLKEAPKKEMKDSRERKKKPDKAKVTKKEVSAPQSRAASEKQRSHKQDCHMEDSRFVQNATWNAMFNKLGKYRAEKGNCLVPQHYPDDPKLATWVKNQRQCHRHNRITDERRQRLDAIGFTYSMRAKRVSWDEMVERFITNVEKHGGCTRTGVADDPRLEKWIKTQHHDRTKLSGAKLDRLEATGFWQVTRDLYPQEI